MWDKAKFCVSWQGKWAVICLWFKNKTEEDPEFLDDVSLNDIRRMDGLMQQCIIEHTNPRRGVSKDLALCEAHGLSDRI